MTISRSFAPVAAPPQVKPPQLNIVASSLLPDVATDTLPPGEGTLTASGWTEDAGRSTVTLLPGAAGQVARIVERRNAILAATLGPSTMAQLPDQQRELDPLWEPREGEMPASIYPATADSRWTGGFAYQPENQYRAALADPCGQLIDLPALTPPTGVTATAGTGGTLGAGTYDYEITAVNGNGETLASSPAAATVSANGKVTLAWNQRGRSQVTSWHVYRKVGTVYDRLATVTSPSYVDTGAGTTTATHHPPTTNTTGGPGSYSNLPIVRYVPFIIQVEDTCSAFGWEAHDYIGRALRLLDNATPNAIEREFWSGAFARNTLTGPLVGSNAFLTQSGTESQGGTALAARDLTPATVPSVTRGIQILEDYLANTGFGGQGMLHVAPETAPNLLGARRLGPLLLSVMDNIIVPGSGYPTTGTTGPIGNAHVTPTTGQAWIFASDLTSVWLDTPVVTPTTLAEAVTRNGGTPNSIRIRAQRFGAVTFDGARLAAVRVKLAT